MSADKRAGFVFEEVMAGTYNSAARKAGDFNTTATTGTAGGFGIDPKVDIRVVRSGKVIAEAQAKCCGKPARTVVSIAKPKYEGTQRVVPAGQGQRHRHGQTDGLQRYWCWACNKTFNALIGTPLAQLRHKAKWLDFHQVMQASLTVRQSARDVGVHRNTSFRWRHRFRT